MKRLTGSRGLTPPVWPLSGRGAARKASEEDGMSAKILIEKHEGRWGAWWTVDLVADNDSVPLASSVGFYGAATLVARRWANHLGIEVKELDWAKLTR